MALVVTALIILLLSVRGIAGFYTDYLWFDSLGYSSVWSGVLLAQVGLALVFILAMSLLVWVNLFIADRIAPSFRPPGPEEEFVRRYHESVGSRSGLMRLGVAALFGLFWGAGAGSRWQDWILFRNSVDFGIEDAQFGIDLGFYVFELPFIRFVINWLFTAFVVVLIITAAAHYLNGGIRMNTPGERVTPQVKRHLSFLLAVLALLKAADYWYQRYSLNFSSRGVVDGASYTDVNAQLPALQLLILISLCAAVLLIVNIWRRGWVLPVVAVGLWAFVAIAMGNVYPALYQRLRVEPNELEREAAFIDRNIEATRLAYGFAELDDDGQQLQIREEEFNFDPDDASEGPLTPELLRENRGTLENIRLLDPGIVSPTFSKLEVERDQFEFAEDLDVDRYMVDGEERVTVVAARELNLAGVRSGWENQHISFTHGYGLAVAPANVVTDEGEPAFAVGGLPTAIDDSIDVGLTGEETFQPRIYVGEGLGGYAIVGTERCEVDFPLTSGASPEVEETVDIAADPDEDLPVDCEQSSGRNQEYAYTGNDGVRAGGILRRAAFALRFQDLNPIFSGLIKDDSKFIYNRDVHSRARELAPFLDFDADSYPAIIDGRIVFILDAYTTTSAYPYSQSADRSSLPSDSDLRGNFNYVRNSVKVTVDAYNGDVNFFIVDETDPIVQAYQKAFPDLFKTKDDPLFTDELVAHLRYPEDLFRIQTNMWATYQLDEAAEFFDDTAAWTVAIDPGRELDSGGTSQTTTATGLTTVTTGDRIAPHYVQMRLPGEEDQEFLILRPFVPSSRSGNDLRQELTAFMVGRVGEDGRQSLVSYRVPGTAVDGPVLANAAMLNNPTVAQRTTLLGQTGSRVRLGNMLLVPVEGDDGDSRILYVRPLYVDAGDLPLARLVIVAYDTTVRMCPTLELALGALFVPEAELDDECSGVVSPLTGELLETSDVPVDEVDRGDEVDGAAEADDEAAAPTAEPTPRPDATATPTPGPVEPPSTDVQELLLQAADRFEQANNALADGDLGRYQELVEEAEGLLADALDRIADAEASGVPPPTPTPDPTPTATPEGA